MKPLVRYFPFSISRLLSLVLRILALALLAMLVFSSTGPARAGTTQANGAVQLQKEGVEHQEMTPEEKYGIKIEYLRLTADGLMLDFRYQAVDVSKVQPLLAKAKDLYVLDQASGARLGVPSSPKLGALRSSPKTQPRPGQLLFILFANPNRFIKAGAKVTVVMGEARFENITVQSLKAE